MCFPFHGTTFHMCKLGHWVVQRAVRSYGLTINAFFSPSICIVKILSFLRFLRINKKEKAKNNRNFSLKRRNESIEAHIKILET
jgi:cell division protein FtsB